MSQDVLRSSGITVLERIRRLFNARGARIYILPTWYCLLFNTAVFCLLAASFPLRSFSLFGLAIFLLFIQLLSMVETHVNLRELKVVLSKELVVEANSSAVLTLDASSVEKTFGVSFRALDTDEFETASSIRFSSRSLRKLLFEELKFSFFKSFHDIDSNIVSVHNITRDPQSLQLSFSSRRRGVHKIPPVVVSSFFPFGLFRAFKVFNFNESYIAYPAPKKMKQVAHGFFDNDVTKEMQRSSSIDIKSGPDDYSHHREFKSGDALQRVDWKASLRRGVKIIKVFSPEEAGRGHVYRWQDTLSKDKEGKLSELSHSVLKASKNGEKYGIELPNLKTIVHAGERHRLDCLRALASFDLLQENLTKDQM